MKDYGNESRYNKKDYDSIKEKDEQEFKPFYDLPNEKKAKENDFKPDYNLGKEKDEKEFKPFYEFPIEKEESKWDTIDWNKDIKEEKGNSDWEPIDWSKDTKEEKRDSDWDTIDWSKDIKEEKGDSDWEPIDWNKDTKEEKRDSDWDTIDWSKDTKEEKRDSDWEPIDWSKYIIEMKKIGGYKNANIDDIIMMGEDFDENIDDTNFDEKEIDNDDLSWLKDFDENFSNDQVNLDKDFIENVEEELKEHEFENDYIYDDFNPDEKDFENINNLSEDNQKDFVEDVADKLEDYRSDKAFIDGIDDDKEHLDNFKDFVEGFEDESKSKDISKEIIDGDKEKVKEINDNNEKSLELNKNKDLAEMTGIILGDGNIYSNKEQGKYLLRISSNSLEEKEYNNYVEQKMKEIFDKSPRIENKKDRAGTDLIIQNKAVVERLKDIGLTPGNKVENQVDVPEWIKQNKQYGKACLRGLVDTDGSIYMRNTQKAFGVNFKNGSYPLVKAFKEMCEDLDIKTQQIPKPKIYTNPNTGETFKAYQITIEEKSQVAKFINTIQPKKWVNRAEIIGINLISLENPENRGKIEQELIEKYPDKKTHYTEEYKEDLKNLCEKNGYTIDENSIREAIKNSLRDKRKSLNNIDSEVLRLIDELDL